jgi:hypothetical protein
MKKLQWPPGWKRTSSNQKQWGSHLKLENSKGLRNELRLLGADQVVISTDQDDDAVAVYFVLKGKRLVMACDRFDSQSANMRSLTLAIAAMRQLERHGGGAMMDRAFAGFTALPPPRSCWEVLGIEPGSNRLAVGRAFRAKALKHHPDQGGSDKAMAELNAARDEAERKQTSEKG